MLSDTEVLMNIYGEELSYAKHHSSMRSNITGLICAIAGAVLALAGNDGLSESDLPLTIFIALLGLFGVLFNLKQYERGHLHRIRATKIREALDAKFPSAQILALRKKAAAVSKKQHPLLRKIDLHFLWCSLNAGVLVLGVVTSMMVFT